VTERNQCVTCLCSQLSVSRRVNSSVLSGFRNSVRDDGERYDDSPKITRPACRKYWKSHSIRISTKIRLMKALVWPVATYGCESWTFRKNKETRLDAFEIKGLRQILRVSWTARDGQQRKQMSGFSAKSWTKGRQTGMCMQALVCGRWRCVSSSSDCGRLFPGSDGSLVQQQLQRVARSVDAAAAATSRRPWRSPAADVGGPDRGGRRGWSGAPTARARRRHEDQLAAEPGRARPSVRQPASW